MSELEVQATIASVLSSRKIVRLLLRRHRVPNCGLRPVSPAIVLLDTRVEDEAVERANADEPAVSTAICGFRGVSISQTDWDSNCTHNSERRPCGRR
jgi:hypothetical protein